MGARKIEAGLEKVFSGIEDPRSKRNQKHAFLSLLGIGLLGSVAGIDSFSGLGDFAEAHEEALKEVIDLSNGPPSHDTLQRFFNELNPEHFLEKFMEFTQALVERLPGVIAIDGKTIRNSGRTHPLHIVSAWCEANQLVLGQVKVDDKSNEITAIPRLLELLDISNKIITIDAMGCQREIAQQIIDLEGDYVMGLKGNQKTLLEDAKEYFKSDFKGCQWQEADKGHGRLEERICRVIDDIDWMQEHHQWPGLKSIAQVISTRTIKDKTTTDTRYYLSSLPANAELLCKAARAHWSVENKLHWRLDVVFNEDKCCIRNDNASENVDIMRKWALNILNKQKKEHVSLKSMQRKAAMSFKFLKNTLQDFFHA